MARKKQAPYYSIGLGNKVLIRAQVIFLVILILVIGTSGSAVYAGYKSGQLKRVFVEPIRSFFSSLANPEASISGQPSLEYKVNVETASPTATSLKSNPQPTQTTKPSIQTNTPTYTIQNNTSYQDQIKAMNAKADQEYQDALKAQQQWAQQQQQQGQQWLQQQSAQNDAAAKASYDQQVQQMQQQTEDWKKAHGF